MKYATFFFLLFSAFAHKKVLAQSNAFLLDQVIAEVEDKIILSSDISNAIADFNRQKIAVPKNPECTILRQLIINKLLAGQARRDSLTVSDEEITNTIDLRIRNFIQLYGSLETLEKVAGRTVFQIRQDFKEQIRDVKLAGLMQEQIVQNTRVTPAQVRSYFLSIAKDSLPYYESEIEVGSIVVYPRASRELDDFLQQELEQYRKQVLGGRVTFDYLVRSYSEDPAKAQNKGVYQLRISDKQWDPNFISASFHLQEGEISRPVKSKFGYHIIQMLERRGTEATVKHVLRLSLPGDAEMQEAKEKLNDIKQQILGGQIAFSKAVQLHSDDEMAEFTGGMLSSPTGGSFISYDQVPPDILDIIKPLNVGEISEPKEFKTRTGFPAFRIIYLKTQTNPHRESLEFDYNKISNRLLLEKQQETMNRWVEKHINRTNWEVNSKYQSCAVIKKWQHRNGNSLSSL